MHLDLAKEKEGVHQYEDRIITLEKDISSQHKALRLVRTEKFYARIGSNTGLTRPANIVARLQIVRPQQRAFFFLNSRSAEDKFLQANNQLESKTLELNKVLKTSEDFQTKYDEESQVRKQ